MPNAVTTSQPDLTVVIPTYEMAGPTRAAVESVHAQATRDLHLHIIVVDDASATPFELADRPPEHCTVEIIRHARNRGAGAARGTGAMATKTRWIAYLDADDTFMPGTLSERFAFAKARQAEWPDVPMFICAGWKQGGQTTGPTRIPRPDSSLAALCSGCWYCPGSTLLVEKRWLTSTPGLPDVNLQRLEDFDWGIRLGLSGGRVEVWPHAAAHIRPSKITNAAAVKQAAEAISAKHADLKRTAPRAWHNIAAYLALERSVIAHREGRTLQAVLLALRSLRHRPRTRVQLSPGWTFE